MPGSSPSSTTSSCSRVTVWPTTRFTGGFENVIVAILGVGRSRLIVLGWLMGVLHSVVFAGGSQCGAMSRAVAPDEGLARGVTGARACAFIILRSYYEHERDVDGLLMLRQTGGFIAQVEPPRPGFSAVDSVTGREPAIPVTEAEQ